MLYMTTLREIFHKEQKYIIFEADCTYYPPDSKYCEYDCDSETIIYKIPKNLLNITFNEFRRDTYFSTQAWCKDNAQLIKWYTNNKKELKLKNKELHDEFYKTPSICFTKILGKYLDYNRWLSFPPKLKFNITNARFIGYHDGNGYRLVAEDDTNFYYAIATGS